MAGDFGLQRQRLCQAEICGGWYLGEAAVEPIKYG